MIPIKKGNFVVVTSNKDELKEVKTAKCLKVTSISNSSRHTGICANTQHTFTFRGKDVILNLGDSPIVGYYCGVWIEPIVSIYTNIKHPDIHLYVKLTVSQIEDISDAFAEIIKFLRANKYKYDKLEQLEVRQDSFVSNFACPRSTKTKAIVRPKSFSSTVLKQEILTELLRHFVWDNLSNKLKILWVKLYIKHSYIVDFTPLSIQNSLDELRYVRHSGKSPKLRQTIEFIAFLKQKFGLYTSDTYAFLELIASNLNYTRSLMENCVGTKHLTGQSTLSYFEQRISVRDFFIINTIMVIKKDSKVPENIRLLVKDTFPTLKSIS